MNEVKRMATIGEMATALAAVTGVSEATVAQVSRILRDAGMITSGGRGRSAAKMTADDCANLLIAVMITDQAKNAPAYVSASQQIYKQPSDFRNRKAENELNQHEHDESGKPISFQNDLSRLLSEMANGAINGFPNIGTDEIGIRVTVSRPLWSAQISVFSINHHHSHEKIFEGIYYPALVPVTKKTASIEQTYAAPGLSIDATVNELVIKKLAQLLKS
ncbi:hypothetical protein ACW7BJ_11965 [Azospirillum argentinense]